VAGVADAIHIATYYIGNILIDANERNPNSASSGASYRPYSSQPRGHGGHGGHGPGQYAPRGPAPPGAGHGPGPGGPGGPGGPVGPGGGGGGGPGYSYGPPPTLQLQEQKIYIPNDLVGCIIGKGGSKINEIRGTSQCTIKIMEPGAPQNAGGGPENERLVVITGAQHNIQLAVSMLHHVSVYGRWDWMRLMQLIATRTGKTKEDGCC
jgi:heterogeneous nuclear rnp K-like protein 2